MKKSFLHKVLSRDEVLAFLHKQSDSHAIAILSADGAILEVNEEFEELLGYPRTEMAGTSLSDLPVAPARPELGKQDEASLWQELRAGRNAYRLRWMLTRDAREVYVANRFFPLRNSRGRLIKVVAIFIDVTEDYSKEAVRRARADTIDKVQAVVEFDVDGKVLSANPIYAKLMGYDRRKLAGLSHRSFCEGILEGEAYDAFWASVLAGNLTTGEYARRRKDGELVYIQANYTRVIDDAGTPFRVIKVAQDVTDAVHRRMKTEEVARKVDNHLEEIVEAVAYANERSSSAASAATQTSDTVQHAASAVGKFESSAQRIVEAMSRSQDAVGHVITETETADRHIGELSKAADSMSSIAEIIQKVAGQINLLALNATIESARAGEAGRGFAVVAQEVKSLADQVESSTNQISRNIGQVQSVSQNVVTGLKGIADAVRSVQGSVSSAGEAVDGQSMVARDLASGMQQAVASVREIDENLAQISHAVAEADASAREGSTLYRSLNAPDLDHTSKLLRA